MDFLTAIKTVSNSQKPLAIRRQSWGEHEAPFYYDLVLQAWVSTSDNCSPPSFFEYGQSSPEDFLATDWEVVDRKHW